MIIMKQHQIKSKQIRRNIMTIQRVVFQDYYLLL